MSIQLSNISMTLEQNTNFIQFVSQLQAHCERVLVLMEVDGVQTLHYDKNLPKTVQHVGTNNDIYQYYDPETKIKYYLFGSHTTTTTMMTKKMKPIMTEYISNHMMVYDQGKKYKFPYQEKKFITTTINIF
jgi:hypothetical protein